METLRFQFQILFLQFLSNQTESQKRNLESLHGRITYMEEEDCDENLESFPLSTWSHDCGLKALSCVSLHDSEGKRFFMGHKR